MSTDLGDNMPADLPDSGGGPAGPGPDSLEMADSGPSRLDLRPELEEQADSDDGDVAQGSVDEREGVDPPPDAAGPPPPDAAEPPPGERQDHLAAQAADLAAEPDAGADWAEVTDADGTVNVGGPDGGTEPDDGAGAGAADEPGASEEEPGNRTHEALENANVVNVAEVKEEPKEPADAVQAHVDIASIAAFGLAAGVKWLSDRRADDRSEPE